MGTGRAMRARWPAVITVIAVVVTTFGCGQTPATHPPASPGTGAGVPIPIGQLPADTQCMVDHGWQLVEMLPPEVPGDPPGYKLESDLPSDQMAAIIEECQKLAPSAPVMTDRELRAIYDRWVKERECLVGLGYHPTEPPTFEKFAADWRTTGPWGPLDGVDTGAWTDAAYQAAKEACTLEMFHRG